MSAPSYYSAFLNGFVLLEEEIPGAGEQSRYKRYSVTIPVKRPTESELGGNALAASIRSSNIAGSLHVYVPPGQSFPRPNEFVSINAKLSLSSEIGFGLDATQLLRLSDEDIGNEDDAPVPPIASPFLYLCGQSGSVHPDLSEYGTGFKGFDLKTGTYSKEIGGISSFLVRVLMPPNKRFAKSPLPQRNSVLNVHGSIVGFDPRSDILLVMLKDYSFLPKPSSSTDDGDDDAPGTPRKRKWARGAPLTPKKTQDSTSVNSDRSETRTRGYGGSTIPANAPGSSLLLEPAFSEDPLLAEGDNQENGGFESVARRPTNRKSTGKKL